MSIIIWNVHAKLRLSLIIILISTLTTADPTRNIYGAIPDDVATAGNSSKLPEVVAIRSRRDPVLDVTGSVRGSFASEAGMMKHENVVCSPLSALMPLAKLALGSTGDTKTELLQAIGVPRRSQIAPTFKTILSSLEKLPGVTLDVVSRIYVDKDSKLDENFQLEARQIFHFAVEKVDFSDPQRCAEKINRWVQSETHDKIKNFLNPTQISKDSSAILVNAVYFRGEWKHPFPLAEPRNFNAFTREYKTLMMTRLGQYNYYNSGILRAEITEIPYKGGESSFIILLPWSQDHHGITGLCDRVTRDPDKLDDALREMKHHEVSLTIPKFRFQMELDLKSVYKKIHLSHIFSSGMSKVVKNKNIVVSTAVQKAMIEVTETGTTAAAASAVEMVLLASLYQERPYYFIADRPFMYIVRAGREQLFAGVFRYPKNIIEYEYTRTL